MVCRIQPFLSLRPRKALTRQVRRVMLLRCSPPWEQGQTLRNSRISNPMTRPPGDTAPAHEISASYGREHAACVALGSATPPPAQFAWLLHPARDALASHVCFWPMLLKISSVALWSVFSGGTVDDGVSSVDRRGRNFLSSDTFAAHRIHTNRINATKEHQSQCRSGCWA